MSANLNLTPDLSPDLSSIDTTVAPVALHGTGVAAESGSAPASASVPGPALAIPATPLFSHAVWLAIIGCSVIGLLLPLFHLSYPAGHALHVPAWLIALLGKFMCYALAALALDLVWGYTGILSLGHGLFFALGAYAHGMYLMRAGLAPGQLPPFMVFLDWKQYPWFWAGTDSFIWCALLVVLVPGLLALVFGWLAFRSRVKGVYFSIITQALTFAFMLLFFRNDTGFGGNNGFTDFKLWLGFDLTAASTRAMLYCLTLLTLLAALVLCRTLVLSRLGKVLQAVRDGEARLMFIGYNPLGFKLFIWVLSALLCALAGALYVPQVGIINPSEMSVANSIEMVVWVAVGGRGTLVGAIMGAFAVNGLKSWFTASFPDLWLFALGALFIGVTLFMRQGLLGLLNQISGKMSGLRRVRLAKEAQP
jgi:urea transport system permease protein